MNTDSSGNGLFSPAIRFNSGVQTCRKIHFRINYYLREINFDVNQFNMPAINNARKRKAPSKGRPSGSVTKFPGSVVFCAEIEKSPSHLFRVLTGERKSASLVERYAAWLGKRNIPWPAEAVVKPKGKAA